ncbi:hypothetical protein AAZX31_06G288200 [Glycine max]|uniref:Uncharacterized protein n=2 Tax=Glycine subgen. Soja TaxID=1462606 RepID=K7KYC9_SOYBN|nr:uncharacterized protein LOC100796231 [Glycine max]XP_028238296.1 uncharacterized protein LOC114417334 [Glycine soja]KAG5021044.1 hypothetical protein JHK87_016899 [Glycine soja]KAH1128333.1 hypothetical protein GYH30_016759 [Glycine max]KAH1248125.1 hypothetical protein GmHk_06G017878 [Glycine max]KRH56170.1 hypothetical protein GLYMA_06G308300v4 [Glycine max]RZC09870.1 hypothetical protein D0Y65_016285 [Glycine soja]|eukprot:XP_014632322.1 uncharacterized protein LOC100796231 [Glycine max]
MPHQVMVRSQPANGHRRRGVGEVAGSAAADCTAVCCCCPCTVVNLVVLAVYKLPKGLVEKAAHKRRRRMPKKNNTGDVKNGVVLLQAQRSSSVETLDIAVGPTRLEEFMKKEWEDEEKGKCEKEEEEGLEKEMWARFAGTGFWRSESQRQP